MVPGDDTPFTSAMTMDEIEESMSGDTQEKPDLSKITADGDDIPEAYRGKSVTDIIKIAEGARTQMNESTRAAQEARDAALRAEGSRTPPPPPPEAPKEMTREELKALYDEDPLAAIAKIEEQAMNRVAAHVEARIAPLTAGTISAAENWARQEFPDEFALFGDEIKGMIDSIPNKQVFSDKKGWQDAISFIRGKAGNFEKLIDHRANKNNTEEGERARGRERESAGFSGRTTVASRQRQDTSSRAGADMNDDERRIAQRFIDDGTFRDMAEYVKWQKMGG